MGIPFLDDLHHHGDLLFLVYLLPLANSVPTLAALASLFRRRPTSQTASCSSRRVFVFQAASTLVALIYDLHSWYSIQGNWTDALRQLSAASRLSGAQIADAANDIFYFHFVGLLLCAIPLIGAGIRFAQLRSSSVPGASVSLGRA